MQSYGLYTHIRANQIRSLLLLASFAALLVAVLYSLTLIYSGLQGDDATSVVFARANAMFAKSWPWAILGAGLWFVIAWHFNQAMVDFVTGSQSVDRQQAPKLYAALETLCISRGIPMPALKIIESNALNAFASGMQEGHYSVSVTQGLIDHLSPQELEAVLGHELTHIRNRDVQMMVVATIFAGIISFVADITLRNWNFPFGRTPRPVSSSNAEGDRKSGSGGAMIPILVGVAILAISWGLSVLIRFAISRKREFIADAGSVELTKNPDAMISALRKIEAHAAIPDMPSRVSSFFIETPSLSGEPGWMSTHPSIQDRVDALVRYAGGIDPGPIAIEPPANAPEDMPAPDSAQQAPAHGPWGDYPKT